MKRFVPGVLLLLGLNAHAIIGGTQVTDPADPVAKSTVFLNFTFEACTGVLIAPDLILTAAHCLEGYLGPQGSIGFTLDAADALHTIYVHFYKSKALPGWSGMHGMRDGLLQDISDLALIHFRAKLPGSFEPAPILVRNS